MYAVRFVAPVSLPSWTTEGFFPSDIVVFRVPEESFFETIGNAASRGDDDDFGDRDNRNFAILVGYH